MWFLLGQEHDEHSGYVPIHSTPFTIGRRSGLSYTLNNPTVSGLHAEIVQVDQSLAVRDLQSTNGTYVNGKRVTAQVVLSEDDLLQFADVAFRVRRQAAHLEIGTVHTNGYDRALALVQFDKLMRDRAVIPHFQPLVRLSDMQLEGYETLGRSCIVGLETPYAMFTAAAQLNLEVELSRMLRWEGLQAASRYPQRPRIFVNTHPCEMDDPGLLGSMRSLREFSDEMPIVLEIHEKAVTDPQSMRELREALRDLDIGLAYDDFGAGQTRLVELVEVRPDYLKFDMQLVQKIDQASAERQKLLEALVRMTCDLGIATLAEGVETEGEHQVCQQLGFDIGQGFYYGKPAPVNVSHAAAVEAADVKDGGAGPPPKVVLP
ncbi:MAG: EAL domain-containing protein [Planctomycetales bacterium]|nr:EAL domain-containing protein [Planctomycetales bacterium]